MAEVFDRIASTARPLVSVPPAAVGKLGDGCWSGRGVTARCPVWERRRRASPDPTARAAAARLAAAAFLQDTMFLVRRSRCEPCVPTRPLQAVIEIELGARGG